MFGRGGGMGHYAHTSFNGIQTLKYNKMCGGNRLKSIMCASSTCECDPRQLGGGGGGAQVTIGNILTHIDVWLVHVNILHVGFLCTKYYQNGSENIFRGI